MFKPEISLLPTNPGVYLYKDEHKKIIYVGKAKNLRKRVSSYFQKDHRISSPKTHFLVSHIADMEVIIVDNEVEALLLENRLIKQHKPKYNINLKDSKTYAYIKITDEKIPKILSTRIVTKKGEYFGPYVDGSLRVHIINFLVSRFKLVTPKTYSSQSQLYFHLGLSPAPTQKEIKLQEYLNNIQKAKEFLRGKGHSELRKILLKEMKEASGNLRFELALEKKKELELLEGIEGKQKVDLLKNYDQDILAFLKDEKKKKALLVVFHIKKGVISGKEDFRFSLEENLLQDFLKSYYGTHIIPKEILLNEACWEDEAEKEVLEEYLSRLGKFKVKLSLPQKGEKKGLVQIALKNAELQFGDNDVLLELQKNLSLPRVPRVIECFDMSNLSYDYLVGGMTRFVEGKEDKAGYRKFEIKSFKGKNDDFAAMKETVFRRYKRLKEEAKDFPDLILIDGGKGQLGAALSALKDLGLEESIPLASLAKKEEEIFLPGKEDSLHFDKNSQMMLLLRKIRDSVHTFVVAYNRKKREMRMREEKKS